MITYEFYSHDELVGTRHVGDADMWQCDKKAIAWVAAGPGRRVVAIHDKPLRTVAVPWDPWGKGFAQIHRRVVADNEEEWVYDCPQCGAHVAYSRGSDSDHYYCMSEECTYENWV
jgi:predicted RNA-binding Zn-ribbon protein involved in translation (DUF1610 family)